MRLVQALDQRRRVTAVPYQRTGVSASFGLTIEECQAAAWAITAEGRRYRGAGAINAAVGVALGNRLPLFFYALPGIRQLQDLLYGFVAANRHRLPLPKDKPYCKQHPDQCR